MEPTERQREVFDRSLAIYKERSEVRGELWAEFDAEDSVHHLKSKVARVEAALKLGDSDAVIEAAIDECLDIINYAAFTIRHLEGETA